MSCAKAGIIRRCAPDAMCLVPAMQNGGPKAAVWVIPWRLHQSAKHFLGFAALGFIALVLALSVAASLIWKKDVSAIEPFVPHDHPLDPGKPGPA